MTTDGQNWQFGALALFGYDVIVADPPWDFALYSEAGQAKSAKAHYATMPLDAIAALRVGDLARGDCLLLLWCCEWAPRRTDPGGGFGGKNAFRTAMTGRL